MSIKRSIGMLLAGIAFSASGSAHAATANGTLGVTATVLSACIVATTDVAFGTYDPTSTSPDDATGSIQVTCTTGTSYAVGLNAGAANGATVTTRQMGFLTNRLNYSLYSDAGRTTNWGNTPGTDTPAVTIAGILPQSFTVYGRVPAQQNVAAGSYADSVTVTVTY